MSRKPRVLSSSVKDLEDDNATLRKNLALETARADRNSRELQLLKKKVQVVSNLLEALTTLKVSDVWRERQDHVEIVDYDRDLIQVHDLRSGKQHEIKSSRSGPTYRRIGANRIQSAEELADDLELQEPEEEKVPIFLMSELMGDESDSEVLSEALPEELPAEPGMMQEGSSANERRMEEELSYTESTPEELTSLMIDLLATRWTHDTLKENLTRSKAIRKELFARVVGTPVMTLQAYTKICRDAHTKLQALAPTDVKQRPEFYHTHRKGFTVLEKKMIGYWEYWNLWSDLQEIKTLRETLARYVPNQAYFAIENICPMIQTYYLATVPVMTLLEVLLFGNLPAGGESTEGFTLIYIPLKKTVTTDPYAFFSLREVKNGIRQWDLENRLVQISMVLAEKIRIHCIELFREIYLDIYHDFTVRSGFRSVAIAQGECQQLVQNLYTVCHANKFCKLLQSLVKSRATIRLADRAQERFGTTTDKMTDQNAFKSLHTDDNEFYEALCQIFEESQPSEVREIWSMVKME